MLPSVGVMVSTITPFQSLTMDDNGMVLLHPIQHYLAHINPYRAKPRYILHLKTV